MIKFIPGKSYAMTSIINSNITYEIKVLNRTEKSVYLDFEGDREWRDIEVIDNNLEVVNGIFSIRQLINAATFYA